MPDSSNQPELRKRAAGSAASPARTRSAADTAAERKLVGALVEGSDRAWREFVTRYAGLVRSRVARVAATCGLAADTTIIDDLVAEVFSALLSNDCAALRGYAGRSSLATYLCVIASRVAMRKSLRIGPSEMEPGVSEQVDPRTTAPLQQVIDAENRVRVHQMIAGLPPKQQNVVRMFHLEGMSYDQISHRLGIPIGSVGPTLKRAEAKLRSGILAGKPNDEPT